MNINEAIKELIALLEITSSPRCVEALHIALVLMEECRLAEDDLK